jgi:acetylornithine deacetylase/succinyl-diaminopimelate desuccinylase-like protein
LVTSVLQLNDGQITRYPHPYNSHANDLARSYILERITNITSGYEHIEVDNDLRSNGSWAQDSLSGPSAVYFEGTNILVKIEGTRNDADSDAVLFSAHYDSVSTAPGTTDDGMGVVTLLQMVEYLAHNRPQRTAVFNINNGEEDWLNGAHAYGSSYHISLTTAS